MDIYRTNIYYYGKDGIPHALRLNALCTPADFVNAADVKWNGVNGVSALADSPDEKTLRVFSTSGYTADRGLFIDTYRPTH